MSTATMTTRTAHPVELGGPARRLWLGSVLARVVLAVSGAAGMAWLVTRPDIMERVDGAVFLAALALMLGLRFATWRLRWLAWTEVPGAWRTYTDEKVAWLAAPSRRADQLVSIAFDVLLAVIGPFLAAQSYAGQLVVGGVAGAVGVMWGSQVGRDAACAVEARRRGVGRVGVWDIASWLSGGIPWVAWTLTGDPLYRDLGFLTALLCLVMVLAVRLARGRSIF